MTKGTEQYDAKGALGQSLKFLRNKELSAE